MSTQPKVALVSGANRGIGLALTEKLLSSTDAVVFAGVRDVAKTTALQALAIQYSGRLHTVKLVSASVEDANAALKEIEAQAGRLDIVVANAGIANVSGSTASCPLSEFEEHWRVNALGPVVLYRAVRDLLLKSPEPQLVWISSVAGSISGLDRMGPVPNGAYGASKAAANFFSRKIAFEEPTLVSIAVQPGLVESDMGLAAIEKLGVTREMLKGRGIEVLTTEESAKRLFGIIQRATIESKMSGTFVDENGKVLSH